jgi:asparagine synthase (glutamine-hydrolysing)
VSGFGAIRVDFSRFTVATDRPLRRIGDCHAALIGFLDNDPADPEERLIARYRAEGASLSATLLGQYAAVIIDHSARLVLLIQDSLGLRTLYYARDGSVLTVGPLVETVGGLRGRHELDGGYFAQLLSDGFPPFRRSPYAGVSRLGLGETLVVGGDGVESVQPWRPGLQAGGGESAARLRVLLDEAVGAALPRAGRVLCELSGGLDSSSVIATARRRAPDLHALTLFSSSGRAGDDDPYAAEMVAQLGLPWHRIDMDRYPVLGAMPGAVAGEPGGERHVLVQGAYRAAVAAARAGVVLTGSGGDVVLGYGGLPPVHLADALAAYRPRAAIATARRWAEARGGVRPWSHYLWHFGAKPAWRHGRRQSLRLRDHQRPPRWMARDFAAHYGITPGAVAQPAPRVSAPGAQYLWESVYRMANTEACSALQQHLPAATRHPLLHRPLVAFMLGLDYAERDGGGLDRVLQRAALADRLPLAIRARTTKGSSAELREATQLHDPGFLDLLTRDSRLVARGWAEPRLWAEQVARARFGVFDHLPEFDAAVMVELWLRRPVAPACGLPVLRDVDSMAEVAAV